MSFGRSGSDWASAMLGADVFVAFWDSSGDPKVVDYSLTAHAQVRVLYVLGYAVDFVLI